MSRWAVESPDEVARTMELGRSYKRGWKLTAKRISVRIPFFMGAVSYLTRKKPRIFMYHRFCGADHDAQGGLDAETFEWQLGQLRKRWRVVTLAEYMGMIRDGGTLPPYVVVLTVDDGYKDFYTVAYPKLKQYGVPATFFIVVDFVDGAWLWWDRIRFALDHAETTRTDLEWKGEVIALRLRNRGEREASWATLVEYSLAMDRVSRSAFLAHLEKQVRVDVPPSPPADYMAVSWKQLQEMSNDGIEVGSHTKSHPILSLEIDATVDEELLGSKQRLEEQLWREVSSFCYPNGKLHDLNAKVIARVRAAGYRGAVVSYTAATDNLDLNTIPRMAVGPDRVDFLWKLSGMEQLVATLKEGVRGFLSSSLPGHNST